MKKIVLTLVLMVLAVLVVGCKPKEVEHQKKELSYTLVSRETITIGKVQKVTMNINDPMYLYYVVDNKVETVKVASRTLYEVGEVIEVFTIDLSYGFSYNVIHLGDNVLDTSLHTYIDIL